MTALMSDVAMLMFCTWALCLCTAALRNLWKAKNGPGPFGLIGMLWRGEIEDKRATP